MSIYEKLTLGFIFTINVIGFALMGFDKYRAKKGGGRVPEKHFFWMAALGGAPGILLAMRKFRHKTRHASFRFGIPALLVTNFIWEYYLIKFLMEVKG